MKKKRCSLQKKRNDNVKYQKRINKKKNKLYAFIKSVYYFPLIWPYIPATDEEDNYAILSPFLPSKKKIRY